MEAIEGIALAAIAEYAKSVIATAPDVCLAAICTTPGTRAGGNTISSPVDTRFDHNTCIAFVAAAPPTSICMSVVAIVMAGKFLKRRTTLVPPAALALEGLRDMSGKDTSCTVRFMVETSLVEL